MEIALDFGYQVNIISPQLHMISQSLISNEVKLYNSDIVFSLFWRSPNDHVIQVEERVIPVEDLLEADEAFCTGTAVTVNPIGAVTYQTRRYLYNLV